MWVYRPSISRVSGADIISFVGQRLAPYKKPKSVEFVDSLPKTTSPLVTGSAYPGGMAMTVDLPDNLARRLAAEAARRGVSPEQVAVEAIAAQLSQEAGQRSAEASSEQSARQRFAFIGMGDSGPDGGDVGRCHEEILREHFANKTARDV